MTPAQRDILSHALGIVHYTQVSYRNNYFSEPMPNLQALVDAGFLRPGKSLYYYVTPAGEQAVREALKPEGNLFGWWVPVSGRLYHHVDLQATVPRGYNRYPRSTCGAQPYYPWAAEPVPEKFAKGKLCKRCLRSALV